MPATVAFHGARGDENRAEAGAGEDRREVFSFDGVLTAATNQAAAFKLLGEPAVQAVLSGYHAAVLAYGRSGSGKTFLVLGDGGVRSGAWSFDELDAEQPSAAAAVEAGTKSCIGIASPAKPGIGCSPLGLLPRALHAIIREIAARNDGRRFSVSLAVGEVYQRSLYDLCAGVYDAATDAVTPLLADAPLLDDCYSSSARYTPRPGATPPRIRRDGWAGIAAPASSCTTAPKPSMTSVPGFGARSRTLPPTPASPSAAPSRGTSASTAALAARFSTRREIPDARVSASPADMLTWHSLITSSSVSAGLTATSVGAQEHDASSFVAAAGVGGPRPALAKAQSVMRSATHARSQASTALNVDSSRSHVLYLVKVRSLGPDGTAREGVLTLADLAGSESMDAVREVTGGEGTPHSASPLAGSTFSGGTNGGAGVQAAREAETKAINSSLHTLTRVVQALAAAPLGSRPLHVPYRESLLTSLLREGIGGNSRTRIVVTLSPEGEQLAHSHKSCQFATLCRSVKNRPRDNAVVDSGALIVSLRSQLEETRVEAARQLTAARVALADCDERCARLRSDLPIGELLDMLHHPDAAMAPSPHSSTTGEAVIQGVCDGVIPVSATAVAPLQHLHNRLASWLAKRSAGVAIGCEPLPSATVLQRFATLLAALLSYTRAQGVCTAPDLASVPATASIGTAVTPPTLKRTTANGCSDGADAPSPVARNPNEAAELCRPQARVGIAVRCALQRVAAAVSFPLGGTAAPGESTHPASCGAHSDDLTRSCVALLEHWLHALDGLEAPRIASLLDVAEKLSPLPLELSHPAPSLPAVDCAAGGRGRRRTAPPPDATCEWTIAPCSDGGCSESGSVTTPPQRTLPTAVSAACSALIQHWRLARDAAEYSSGGPLSSQPTHTRGPCVEVLLPPYPALSGDASAGQASGVESMRVWPSGTPLGWLREPHESCAEVSDRRDCTTADSIRQPLLLDALPSEQPFGRCVLLYPAYGVAQCGVTGATCELECRPLCFLSGWIHKSKRTGLGGNWVRRHMLLTHTGLMQTPAPRSPAGTAEERLLLSCPSITAPSGASLFAEDTGLYRSIASELSALEQVRALLEHGFSRCRLTLTSQTSCDLSPCPDDEGMHVLRVVTPSATGAAPATLTLRATSAIEARTWQRALRVGAHACRGLEAASSAGAGGHLIDAAPHPPPVRDSTSRAVLVAQARLLRNLVTADALQLLQRLRIAGSLLGTTVTLQGLLSECERVPFPRPHVSSPAMPLAAPMRCTASLHIRVHPVAPDSSEALASARAVLDELRSGLRADPGILRADTSSTAPAEPIQRILRARGCRPFRASISAEVAHLVRYSCPAAEIAFAAACAGDLTLQAAGSVRGSAAALRTTWLCALSSAVAVAFLQSPHLPPPTESPAPRVSTVTVATPVAADAQHRSVYGWLHPSWLPLLHSSPTAALTAAADALSLPSAGPPGTEGSVVAQHSSHGTASCTPAAGTEALTSMSAFPPGAATLCMLCAYTAELPCLPESADEPPESACAGPTPIGRSTVVSLPAIGVWIALKDA